MLTSYAKGLKLGTAELSFAPPCTNREFWNSFDNQLSRLILQHSDISLHSSIPTLSASQYLLFTQTGNRKVYEDPYFERRRMLGTLTLSYCLKPQKEIIVRIIDLIWTICEESSWCLPAHNSYIRDTEQLPLPVIEDPIIDLFSAETAASLCQVYSLLKPELGTITPIICARIEREIQKRILVPYLHSHFWWMGNGDEVMNNWTVWCTQNVLLSTFLLPTNANIKEQVVKQALYSLDCFLKDYGEDGCCSEGAQYYRHAGLCLYLCIDILNRVSNNHFISVFEQLKIKNIASFIQHINAQGPYYFNFSDCAAKPGPCTVREYLFAKAVKDPILQDFVQQSYSLRQSDQMDLPDEISLTYRLLELLYHDVLVAEPGHTQTQATNHIYESVGIYIFRDARYALAVKAGSNDDSHNHNDCGSLTLYKDGKPLLIDIGVETYTKKTFSKDRYAIWTMQSFYHNVSNFPPIGQHDGKDYRSTVIEHNENSIHMELSGCYEASGDLQSYHRTVIHRKDAGIIIQEKVKSKMKPVLTLMVSEMPNIQSSHITIGNFATLSCHGNGIEITSEPIKIIDQKLLSVWPPKIYRIMISYESELTVDIT